MTIIDRVGLGDRFRTVKAFLHRGAQRARHKADLEFAGQGETVRVRRGSSSLLAGRRASSIVVKDHRCICSRKPREVESFYLAALADGGRDNGKPGLGLAIARTTTAPLLDPDGHNIEAIPIMAGDLTGGCQCGAVRFSVGRLGRASVCHCRMCQKAFGSFSVRW